MRKNGGVLEHFLKSLLVAIFAAVVAFAPAHADDPCRNLLDNNGYFPKNGTLTSSYMPEFSTATVPNNRIPEIRLEAGVTYTLSLDVQSSIEPFDLSVGAGNGSFTKDIRRASGINGRRSITFTPTEADLSTGNIFALRVPRYSERKDFTYFVSNVQLERGSTATAYQPYNPLCATCDGIIKTYESAVGTVARNGTPTPTNPIEPTFYTQGDMILRKVGDVADSYDATTGKITRRVGVLILTESTLVGAGWAPNAWGGTIYTTILDMEQMDYTDNPVMTNSFSNTMVKNNTLYIRNLSQYGINSLDDFKSYLTSQYSAGTPVTVYYPLATPVEETVTSTTYCVATIKVATTAYNNNAFSSVQTALNSAVDTIKTVVANTILQTTAVQQIASDKQNRPSSGCPTGKTCLLVEDMNGEPHWYEIIEEYIPPEPEGPEPTPVTP